MKHPIYPCIWFNSQSKETATFYCSLFSNSKIVADTPMVTTFELAGELFMGLNGGPVFQINPSISMFVNCASSEEVEMLNDKLTKGGSSLMALGEYPWSKKYAWVKDKFGLTWQLMLNDVSEETTKITPLFLFSNKQFGRAKQAIQFYTSIFPNSNIGDLQLYGTDDAQVEGNLKFGEFILNKKSFAAMDGPGNHNFEFNEGLSFVVNCDTQEEIDYYWGKLTEGGQESNCGWLKDKFGVSWQVVPTVLGKLMQDKEKAPRVMEAFLKMKKFDIAKLLNA